MKTLVWIGAVLLTLIIQATLLPLIAYKGIRPDLLLIMVMSAGLLGGKEQGVGVGFFCGVLQDLASGNIFGLNTLSKMATAYAFGLSESKVVKEHLLLPLLAGAVATLIHSTVSFMFLAFVGYKMELLPLLSNQVVPFMVYNVIVSIPMHQLVYRINKIS